MKRYVYYYDNQPIRKNEFLRVVPKNWEQNLVDGEFLFGYYKAILIEN